MQFKAIVLELIQARPQMHERLRRSRKLLQALEHYSLTLRNRHEDLKDILEQVRPGTDPSQLASEALEIAVQELAAELPDESAPSDDTFPLDQAMACIRNPTQPG